MVYWFSRWGRKSRARSASQAKLWHLHRKISSLSLTNQYFMFVERTTKQPWAKIISTAHIILLLCLFAGLRVCKIFSRRVRTSVNSWTIKRTHECWCYVFSSLSAECNACVLYSSNCNSADLFLNERLHQKGILCGAWAFFAYRLFCCDVLSWIFLYLTLQHKRPKRDEDFLLVTLVFIEEC